VRDLFNFEKKKEDSRIYFINCSCCCCFTAFLFWQSFGLTKVCFWCTYPVFPVTRSLSAERKTVLGWEEEWVGREDDDGLHQQVEKKKICTEKF